MAAIGSLRSNLSWNEFWATTPVCGIDGFSIVRIDKVVVIGKGMIVGVFDMRMGWWKVEFDKSLQSFGI